MFTPKGEKKRRQGLWVNNFFTKEEEVKEETISSPQLVRIVETNNIKTITIFFRIIEAIKNFENSQTGIIIMLIVICFSIFFYDIKTLCLPVYLKNIFGCVYFIIFIYSFFDCIFRNLIIEKLFCSIYFWEDFFSCILMIFDIDSISYSLLEKLLYPNHQNKYLSYEEQSFIELFINLFQVFKLLKVIKFYRLLVDIIKEKERQKNIKKKIEKLLEKKNKFNKSRIFHQMKATYTSNVKETNKDVTTSLHLNHASESLFKSSQKRSKKNSLINSSSKKIITILVLLEKKKILFIKIKIFLEKCNSKVKLNYLIFHGL